MRFDARDIAEGVGYMIVLVVSVFSLMTVVCK